MSLVLLAFSPELTNMLKIEFGYAESGTYLFLELIYSYVILLFLNVSATKYTQNNKSLIVEANKLILSININVIYSSLLSRNVRVECL